MMTCNSHCKRRDGPARQKTRSIHGLTNTQTCVCPVGHTLTRTGCAAALAHINRGTTPNPNIDNYFDPIHPLRVKGVPLL